MKRISAYSLMEMMVVIGLICLLMQLLKPTYDGLIKKARYIEVLNTVSPIKLSIVFCYMQKGSFNACSSGQYGILNEGRDYTVKLIQSIEVQKGMIHVIPKEMYGFNANDDLVLKPYVRAGGIRWKMSGGAITKGWVHSED